MSVQLRLARHGTRNRPFYHIVACDHKMARNGGNFIEKLGVYDPAQEPSLIDFKEDRLRYWYETGAELSTAVAAITKAKKIKLERKKTVGKKAK